MTPEDDDLTQEEQLHKTRRYLSQKCFDTGGYFDVNAIMGDRYCRCGDDSYYDPSDQKCVASMMEFVYEKDVNKRERENSKVCLDTGGYFNINLHGGYCDCGMSSYDASSEKCTKELDIIDL